MVCLQFDGNNHEECYLTFFTHFLQLQGESCQICSDYTCVLYLATTLVWLCLRV